MRFVLVIVLLFLISTLAWAGTWRDDFEGENLDDWKPDTLGRAEKVEWKIEDGELSGKMINNLPDNWITTIVTGSTDWDNYDLQVKVKLVGEKQVGWSGLGIAVRSQAQVLTGFYSLAFFLNQVAAYKRQVFNVVFFLAKPMDVVPNKWYKLKIAVHGKHIEYYLDNHLLTKIDDNTFLSGAICLWIANLHVHFDDVIISGPGIPDGGRWDPSKHGEMVNLKAKLATTWGKTKQVR